MVLIVTQFAVSRSIDQSLISEPSHVTMNGATWNSVILLRLMTHKLERSLMSLKTDGDLASQTDQKFLNWVLETRTEF